MKFLLAVKFSRWTIRGMHLAYCRLDTVSVGRCSALMMQKIKSTLFLCSIKRKAIKLVVKWSRPKIRLATNASSRKYSQYLKYCFIKQKLH